MYFLISLKKSMFNIFLVVGFDEKQLHYETSECELIHKYI